MVLVVAALAAAWWMVASVALRDTHRNAGIIAPSAETLAGTAVPAAGGEPQRRDRAARAPPSQQDEAVGVDAVQGRVVVAPTADEPSGAGPADASLPTGTTVYVFPIPDPQVVIGDDIPSRVTAAATPHAGGAFSIDVPRVPGRRGFVVTARAPGGWLSPLVPADEPVVVLTLSRAPETISLRVIDADDGRPVGGATLRVGWPSQDPTAALRVIARSASTSADDGSAKAVVLDGEELEVTAPGFVAVVRQDPRDGDLIPLRAGAPISGTVVRAGGAPVADAIVEIGGSPGQIRRTNGAGEFRFNEAELSSAGTLTVRALNFETAYVDASPGSTDIVVELAPAPVRRLITIRAVGPDGTPLAGADVPGYGATDESGCVRGDAPAGRTEIRAAWPGWVAGTLRGSKLDGRRVLAPAEQTDGADFEIRLSAVPTSFVVVRALDPAGRPIENAKFTVAGSTAMTPRADGAQVHSVCGDPGTAALVTLASPGPPEFPGIAPRRVTTTGAPADAPADFALTAPRRIEVVVDPPRLRLRAGHSFGESAPTDADAVAVWVAQPESWNVLQPLAEADGSIVWNVTPRERVTIRAAGAGIAEINRDVTEAELAAGRVELRMTTGFAVQARAEAAGADGAVVASGARLIRRVDDRFRGVPAQRIEADGSFRFANVEPGAWTLEICYPGSLVAVSRPLEVRSDMDLGTIAVPAPVALRGTVALPDDRPAGGAEVLFTVTDADGATAEATTFTRSDGSFELRVPPAAAGTVRISKRGFGSIVALAGGGRTMPREFRLAAEGRIVVRLRKTQRESRTWSVHVESLGDTRVSWQPELAADSRDGLVEPDGDKVMTFRGLAPGRVLVIAEGAGWRFDAPVTIVAGETAVVTLGE